MNTLKSILTVGVLGFAAVAYGDTRILVDAEASESTEGEVLSYKTIEGAVGKATELAKDEANKPISVCVKDGRYELAREIVLTNGVTLASENGRARVTLVPAANCRAVAVTGGTLAGVTIQGRTYVAGTTLVSDVDTTARGFGIYMLGNASLVTNCLVRGVVLEGAQETRGGALYLEGNGYCRDSVFTGCEGAFYVVETVGNAPRLWNCTVTENKVASPVQAVFWVQGGARLLNCLVADNEGADSAIFFNVWTYTTMDNCTVAGNTSAGVSMGSALGFTLNNCAIIGNSGGAFALSSDNKNAYKLYNCAYDADSLPTNFTVVESCLQIAPDAYVFADAASGDWHPVAGSPLINAGTRQGLDAEGGKVKTDLDGRARINGVLDIGCYEFNREWDVPVLQVGLDRLGTPQVVSQAGTSIKFRPQLLRHGKKIEAESATFSYVWNGEEKAFGADGTASETFAAGQAYDLVLKAVYDGQTVSASLPKAFVCVDSETTGKTFWVGLSGSNESPYDTPEKAAHSPVDAAKVAILKENKDATVLVMDGVYRFDETIRLTNGVRMASVAGDPRRVVFSGGTQNRMFTIGVDWSVRFNGSGELSGVTVQDAQARDTSETQCRGVLIQSGCISNCVIRNIGGALTWQKASDGCALTLATNWGGPGAKAVDCVIEDNVSALYKGEQADGYAKNGAAVKIGRTGLMDRCIVRNNRADDNKRETDERVHGAGVFMEHASAVCRNTLVANNVSLRALGGVCLKAGRIENCTIAGNASAGEETTVYGGGLYVAGGTNVNTIVTGNFAGTQEVNVACADGVDVASAFVNCCLKGFSWGTDCLSEDAQLDADFRPGEKSPVVNRGRKLDWMTAETLDLAHNPRVQKRKVDMGCYETSYESTTGILIIIR